MVSIGDRLLHRDDRPRPGLVLPDRVRRLSPRSPGCSPSWACVAVKRVRAPARAIHQAQETKLPPQAQLAHDGEHLDTTHDRAIEIAGPWQHRHVAANGARFHVAELPARAPLVLLLHGFPQFWWAWRAPAAGARRRRLPGRRDGPARLRRLDKPPRGYDPFTLAADVAGVIRALGERGAVARRARLGRVHRLGDRRAAPREVRGARARCPRRTRWPCCSPHTEAGARPQAPPGHADPAGAPSAGSPIRRRPRPA